MVVFEDIGEHDDLVIAAALVCWWAEIRFLCARPNARLALHFTRKPHPKDMLQKKARLA